MILRNTTLSIIIHNIYCLETASLFSSSFFDTLMDSIQSINIYPMLLGLSPYVYLPGSATLFIPMCFVSVYSFQSIFLYIFTHFVFPQVLRLVFEMERDESSSSSFPMGETAQEKGFSHVPQCYTLPTSNRPSLNPETVNVHVVDWAALNNPDQRSHTINEIKIACSRSGCFQVSLPN